MMNMCHAPWPFATPQCTGSSGVLKTFAGQAEFARPNKKTEASAKKEIKKKS